MMELVAHIENLTQAVERLETREPSWTPGMIVLWAGSVGDIPEGWHRCDGTNGTPDLTASEIGATVFVMKL